jgi:hypothetical protein
VLLQDAKGRRYPIIAPGAGGDLPHPQGAPGPRSGGGLHRPGQRLLVLRPTVADYPVQMPPGAQVIRHEDRLGLLAR